MGSKRRQEHGVSLFSVLLAFESLMLSRAAEGGEQTAWRRAMPFGGNMREEESLSLNKKWSDLDHAEIFCELELI